jgi:hypothetical protein
MNMTEIEPIALFDMDGTNSGRISEAMKRARDRKRGEPLI